MTQWFSDTEQQCNAGEWCSYRWGDKGNLQLHLQAEVQGGEIQTAQESPWDVRRRLRIQEVEVGSKFKAENPRGEGCSNFPVSLVDYQSACEENSQGQGKEQKE